jgi:hypothetical protein
MTETANPPSPSAVGVRFGLIFGVIGFIYFISFSSIAFETYQAVGDWINRAIALAFVIFAHRHYKTKGDGFMSYGQGMTIAVLIGVISSFLRSIATYIYLRFINPGFIDAIRDKVGEEMDKQNNSGEGAEMAEKIMGYVTSPGALAGFEFIFGIILLVFIGLIVSIFTKNESTKPPF